jgi:hypothetical protein
LLGLSTPTLCCFTATIIKRKIVLHYQHSWQNMAALDDRIKAQEEKLKQLKALKQKQEAMKRAADAKKVRADETRRKILIGAMLLDQMEKNEAMKKNIIGQLDSFLTRPDDRALFNIDAAAPAAPQQHNRTGQ